MTLRTLLCVLLATTLGFAVTSKPRPNSLGVPEFLTNPNTYVLGRLVDGAVMNENGRYATSLRIAPSFTAGLYTEDLLVCGNVADAFDGMTGPVVITYRTHASRKFKGVACHELVSVAKVQNANRR